MSGVTDSLGSSLNHTLSALRRNQLPLRCVTGYTISFRRSCTGDNLANFSRIPPTRASIKDWSLTSVNENLTDGPTYR
jgi:hypothetical protein